MNSDDNRQVYFNNVLLQQLVNARQLTVLQWNNIINSLALQGNHNATVLKNIKDNAIDIDLSKYVTKNEVTIINQTPTEPTSAKKNDIWFEVIDD